MNYMRPFLKFTFWTFKICEKVCFYIQSLIWHQFNIINSYILCQEILTSYLCLLPSLQSDISDAIWLSATIWNFFFTQKLYKKLNDLVCCFLAFKSLCSFLIGFKYKTVGSNSSRSYFNWSAANEWHFSYFVFTFLRFIRA